MSPVSKAERTSALIIGVVTCSLLIVFAIATTQQGCSSAQCTIDDSNPNEAVPSFDCPSGDLCYAGQCYRACNAGAERSQRCTTDDDCTNSALPRCIFSAALQDFFCSTCEGEENCVIGLNVCRDVKSLIDPAPPVTAPIDLPPGPLDGGQLDAVTFEKDASEPPSPQSVTHAGTIALEHFEDYETGGVSSRAFGCVDFADVRQSNLVEGATLLSAGSCSLIRPNLYTVSGTTTQSGIANHCGFLPSRRRDPTNTTPYPPGVAATSLGEVTVKKPPLLMMDAETIALFIFDPMVNRFRSTAEPFPPTWLKLSAPAADEFVTISSMATSEVREWPTNREGTSVHVPYRMMLKDTTLALFNGGTPRGFPIVIEPNPTDIVLEWTAVRLRIAGENVVARILSPNAPYLYIQCTVSEVDSDTSSIRILSSMLRAFRDQGNVSGEVPLEFGRTLEKLLSINSLETTDAGEPLVIPNTTLRISHTHRTTLTF